jgi:hypothetical protein
MGLIRKRPAHIGQKVHDIGIALRLVLHYVAQRGSMRMTTTVAAVAGIVSISQPALFKWMCKIGAYLEALVARMVEPGRYASEAWGGYVLIAADATTVVHPGAKGTTARLHYALHLSDLRPRACAHHQRIDKSIGQLDGLPNFLPKMIHAWLCAKVLLDLIAPRLASQPVAIPPSGLADAILPPVRTSDEPVRARRRALVCDADGVECPSRRPSAHQAA